jgi:uncharacterized protein YyaL (SSP411 family)
MRRFTATVISNVTAVITVNALLIVNAILIVLVLLSGCRGNKNMENQKNPTETAHTNRLINEKSPYLLQHAHNPVDWYPWGDEAFETARKQNKPIFLSIGYSTCHWCHVMERESFEDEEVAGLLNRAFISIKVDREERPDIDSLYMSVAHMMTGRGGWPLTIIMTPEKEPFYAATYLPKHSRPGLMGMMDLIPAIEETWKTRQQEIEDTVDKVRTAISEFHDQDLAGAAPGDPQFEKAFEQLKSTFEPTHGGFGNKPKFPTLHNLMFLIRYGWKTGDSAALEMVEKTLRSMRRGGIYDHVGYGFHRYSTDEKWLVPHFEKMLYDQAIAVMAYTEAYLATGEDEYAQTAREVLKYVLRDMRSPEGGFYSAEDADSEGEEGKFYLWTQKELERILGKAAAALIAMFNVEDEGNFRDEATGEKLGTNILHLTRSLTPEEQALWSEAREKLFEEREKRIHPLKDDKILTDWNGLMIKALAKAARALGEPEYEQAAIEAADFLLEKMRTPQGGLVHRYRQAEAAFEGNLNDYAFLIDGLIELHQTTQDLRFLHSALELTERMVAWFWDEEEGGFFQTGKDHEVLFVRQKESFDYAIPSGNSAAMIALIKLSRLTGDTSFEERALEIGKAFSKKIAEYPSVHTYMMEAIAFLSGPSVEVVVVGPEGSKETKAIYRELAKLHIPNKVVLLKTEDNRSELARLAPYTEPLSRLSGKATVYVCQSFACELPTTDPMEMRRILERLIERPE